MISGTELKVLKLLFGDFTSSYTIREISLLLELPYPQVHRSVALLLKKELISRTKKGKSSIISLIFKEMKDEYISVEVERKKEILGKYINLRILYKNFDNLKYSQYMCILFGSYAAGKAKRESDIDLLFVIPSEYDYAQFERAVRTAINTPNVDINITTEVGLVEMWNTPAKLNVGNELLKKHIILKGVEQYLQLRRKYYVG